MRLHSYMPVALVAAILICLLTNGLAFAQEPVEGSFGAKYSELRPQQKRLVDDWFARLAKVVEKPIDPAEAYEQLPLSVKTTLSAVSHALLRSKLTDESGKPLAESALSLIEKVDNVRGRREGTRGDEQFRIYAQLRAGSLELLERSVEFGRAADNTVYHKGYPICYRGRGGAPSIQISVSRDGKRADIDGAPPLPR